MDTPRVEDTQASRPGADEIELERRIAAEDGTEPLKSREEAPQGALAPGSPAWPCRTPFEPRSERLVAFLYVLLRDHAQPGDVEGITLNLVEQGHDEPHDFTNPHLESYARALATFLTPGSEPT